jgi:hypothetical protein
VTAAQDLVLLDEMRRAERRIRGIVTPRVRLRALETYWPLLGRSSIDLGSMLAAAAFAALD